MENHRELGIQSQYYSLEGMQAKLIFFNSAEKFKRRVFLYFDYFFFFFPLQKKKKMQAENNNTPTVTESPRKYMQWKDEDIALLLKDLEKPGNYEKWKENKSVYSKRVSSEVFDNNFNCETIKFKIRWLELRHQYWFDVLSNTNEHQAIFVRGNNNYAIPSLYTVVTE